MSISAVCSWISCFCCYQSDTDQYGPLKNDPSPADYSSCQVSEIPISMPRLSTETLELLTPFLGQYDAREDQLGSQGLYVSPDGSYAYNHASSLPSSYFKIQKGLPFAINMDRGGVVCRKNGSLAACIADGVSGAGYFSAYVAHMIADYFLQQFATHSLPFTEDMEKNSHIALKLFADCTNHVHARTPGKLHGASTALLVECMPTENTKYLVKAIALGDSAVFHINTAERTSTQLNKINRKCDEEGKPIRKDSGGCIHSNGKIYLHENICAAYTYAEESDYLVLVTDGFLDNVKDGRVNELIALVAFHPFFDKFFELLMRLRKRWDYTSELPSIEQLYQFISDNSLEEIRDFPRPTAEQITTRLATYVKIVTTYYRPEKLHSDDAPKPDDYMIITISPGVAL
ncbi:MAG: hypothetical protein JSR46_00515 [Verrucomicrobia bacterium]|nr:hypothetical protein [Verrucomicrobiota bacterium]